VTRRLPLEKILQQEIASPASEKVLLDRLSRELPDQAALLDFLALKIEHSQRLFYVRAERAWFRRFGWRIIRPTLVLGVLASVGFALQRRVDPTLGIMLFLAGAATLYVVIQLMAIRWADRNLKKLPDFEAEYRSRLEEQLARLSGSEPPG